jgi:hypothetical protein
MDLDFLIPVSMFAMIAAVVIVPQILKSRERARMHETLRTAYEKGQPVPPELIEALQTDYLAVRRSGLRRHRRMLLCRALQCRRGE